MHLSTTNIALATPTLEDIWSLQAAASSFPQIELPTEHYFANGMYCRKITMPKGSLVVGKVHTSLHLFMCVKGACTVWTELESRNFVAGDVVVSVPGTKRVTRQTLQSLKKNLQKKTQLACMLLGM